jgi:glycosyltransferase involved in cell wall biosynthesis
MRICMFNNLFPPIKSGSSHFSAKLSQMLAQRGHEITVVTARLDGTAEREQVDGLDIHRLPCFMMPQLQVMHGFKYFSYSLLPGNIKRLKALCREKQFDVLHQHGQIFDTALSSAYLARKYRIPLVTTIHTPVRHTVPLYRAILVSLDKTIVKHLIISKAQMLIAPDHTVVDNINERYQHKWVVNVPYGVDRLDVRPERAIEIRRKYNLGDLPIILSLGHVHNLRDRMDLIEAMPLILKNVPNAHLMIVGDIYTQRPVELVKSLGLESHVTFTGGVPHEEIGAYLAAATIEAAWGTAGPGLGIAAMEAMLAGKAVVSSIGSDDFGKDILRPNHNIMMVTHGVVDDIADVIVRLLRDENLRNNIGMNGRKMIEDHFSWENVADKMEAAYEELISTCRNSNSAI